jgi:hypothetical protein
MLLSVTGSISVTKELSIGKTWQGIVQIREVFPAEVKKLKELPGITIGPELVNAKKEAKGLSWLQIQEAMAMGFRDKATVGTRESPQD